MPTIHELAEELRGYLETRKRTSGEEFITFKDGAPEWAKDIAYAVHGSGEMLPNDWSYIFLDAAVDAIADSSDEDEAREQAETPDHATHKLLAWLGSHSIRMAYVDEAIDEWFTSKPSMFELLQRGQSQERGEVFSTVWRALEKRIEELDAEEEERDEV